MLFEGAKSRGAFNGRRTLFVLAILALANLLCVAITPVNACNSSPSNTKMRWSLSAYDREYDLKSCINPYYFNNHLGDSERQLLNLPFGMLCLGHLRPATLLSNLFAPVSYMNESKPTLINLQTPMF